MTPPVLFESSTGEMTVDAKVSKNFNSLFTAFFVRIALDETSEFEEPTTDSANSPSSTPNSAAGLSNSLTSSQVSLSSGSSCLALDTQQSLESNNSDPDNTVRQQRRYLSSNVILYVIFFVV